MPVDTSNVDARSFYSRYVNITSKKWIRNIRSGEFEMYGSCPWCSASVDSFMFTDTGRYTHSIRSGGCGRHGSSPYWFLRDYEGLNHWEACERLNIDPGSEYIAPARKQFEDQPAVPCKAWQERASAYVHIAQKMLWSNRGKEALAYLRSRGLCDATIHNAKLGYMPFSKDGSWYKDSSEKWGLTVDESVEDDGIWLPEGILIPWYSNDDEIWKLCIRRLHGLKKDDNRYFDIKGSREMLYNFDALKVGSPVVVVEGPIDALIGNQECKDAVFVATGSTGKGRRDHLIKRLLLASHILIAFDDDELKDGKRAGDEGAKRWLELIPSATHWLPWSHDINDMLLAGIDLREWLAMGIEANELINFQSSCSQTVTPMQEDTLPAQEPEKWFCSGCGVNLDTVDTAAYSPDGKPFCDCDEITKLAYCSRKPMDYEQFISYANRLAADLTDRIGDQWTITPIPQGYTLKQHVATLLEHRASQQPTPAEPTAAAKKKASMPKWLIPDTYDWRKQVERNGIAEMMERRHVTLQQMRGLPNV